jgi:peroxiredoxin Q/BCP
MQIGVLKDAYEMLLEFGASVVAVSADTPDSHRAFAQRVGGVPFPLASDVGLVVARQYGVVDEVDSRRAQRAVFVIERDGVIALTIAPFQTANLAHVEAIFSILGAEG